MLVPQTLSSAVSCHVIVLWYHHQQAQLACPSQERGTTPRLRKGSFLCSVQSGCASEQIIVSQKCIVYDYKKPGCLKGFREDVLASQHLRLRNDCVICLFHLRDTNFIQLPGQQKGEKRRKADHTFLQAVGSLHLFLLRQGKKHNLCLPGC